MRLEVGVCRIVEQQEEAALASAIANSGSFSPE
jgi:hypothetical protein